MKICTSSTIIEVSSKQSRRQFYIHRAAGAAAAAAATAMCYQFLFPFLLGRHRVRFHNRAPGANRL